MTDSLDARCKERVFIRDTYRYTGGKARFKMHYQERQCKRLAGPDGYCWQHPFGKEVKL